MYRWIALIVLLGYTALGQPQEPPGQTSGQNPIKDFFDGFTANGENWANAAYGPLSGSIETMSPTQIAAGMAVIDRELDNTVELEDRRAECAAGLLNTIGERPDGLDLLWSQIPRLSSLLNGPSRSLAGSAMVALLNVFRNRPELLVPIFEAQLKAPEVAHPLGVGIAPEVAFYLLTLVHVPGDEAVNQVAQYLRRPDLADDEVLATIRSMNQFPAIPDAIIESLVRSLDRPDEQIKIQALTGIAKASPSAKTAARTRIEKIANDPGETTKVRGMAAELLKGNAEENPGVSAGYQSVSGESSRH